MISNCFMENFKILVDAVGPIKENSKKFWKFRLQTFVYLYYWNAHFLNYSVTAWNVCRGQIPSKLLKHCNTTCLLGWKWRNTWNLVTLFRIKLVARNIKLGLVGNYFMYIWIRFGFFSFRCCSLWPSKKSYLFKFN